MIKDIYLISEDFATAIEKLAAKEKTGRKKVVSSLEKSKKNYSKLKAALNELESQASKINAALEKTRSHANAARKDMMKFHKTIQHMDLTNATDAVFYDSGDVGYVVDGVEQHVSVDDMGEVKMTPKRRHRKENKAKDAESDDNDASYTQEVDDASDEDGGDVQDVSFSDDVNYISDKDVDDLYLSLLRTARIHESAFKKLAEESHDENEANLLTLLEELEGEGEGEGEDEGEDEDEDEDEFEDEG